MFNDMFSPLEKLYIVDFTRNIYCPEGAKTVLQAEYQPVGTGLTDK
jgi:hypothetical protein